MLAVSLVMDGATGALEDKVLEETGWGHGEGTFDLMMVINLWVRRRTKVAGNALALPRQSFDPSRAPTVAPDHVAGYGLHRRFRGAGAKH